MTMLDSVYIDPDLTEQLYKDINKDDWKVDFYCDFFLVTPKLPGEGLGSCVVSVLWDGSVFVIADGNVTNYPNSDEFLKFLKHWGE